jgi:hypothetical protein
MAAYRFEVRTARAVSGSGARSRTAVPSQVAPIVGQQRAVRNQLVPVGRYGRVDGLPRAEAEHEVPVATGPAAGKIPHGSLQRVAPPAQQHVPVHAGLVVGLVERERASGGGVGQVDDVHAAGGRFAVTGERRATGDHLRRVPVHVRPMLFHQLVAQRHRAGPIAVVAEELHVHSLSVAWRDSRLITRPAQTRRAVSPGRALAQELGQAAAPGRRDLRQVEVERGGGRALDHQAVAAGLADHGGRDAGRGQAPDRPRPRPRGRWPAGSGWATRRTATGGHAPAASSGGTVTRAPTPLATAISARAGPSRRRPCRARPAPGRR